MGLSSFNRLRREAEQVVSVEIAPATEKVVIAEMETTTEELTKAQIIEKLEEKGIKYDARQKKELLLELLKAGI